MKITTFNELVNTISDYFNNPPWTQTDTVFALLLPGFIFMLWLFMYSNPEGSNKDPFSDISEKDMNTIKQIASQKGLSEFDRDFLVMQALSIYVKPVTVLLDLKTFERLQKVLETRSQKDGNTSNLQNLQRIKSKLF